MQGQKGLQVFWKQWNFFPKWNPRDLSLLMVQNWDLHEDTTAMFNYQEEKPNVHNAGKPE